MQRRDFLCHGAAAAAALLPLGRTAWAARLDRPGPRLVVVFLRGAVDGLNVVIPYTDESYYDDRPTIALTPPGGDGGVRDLDGRFGLHPALDALLPLWQQKQLAFIHACGSPEPERSHFEAQAYMETGTPGVRGASSGWMNRLATALHFDRATETVAFGAAAPLIVRGPAPVATFPTGPAATRPQAVDRDAVRHAFGPIYRADPRLGAVWREGEQTRAELLASLEKDMQDSAQGAPDPQGFPSDASRAARMMTGDPGLRLVFFQLGGWDTHVNQGTVDGQLARHLAPLGAGLAAFRTALGPIWDETVVLVISEFGRTARENGNGGTDHGHGNAYWLLGGRVGGGRVYADWRGLSREALHQERDLPVTTDFRSVISLVMERHLDLPASARAQVLPGFTPDVRNIDRLLRA
jgi:uncharacterized protein (DUF1501 family)